MCRNAINFLYNPGRVTLWCLEVVLVVYARVLNAMQNEYITVKVLMSSAFIREQSFNMPGGNPWNVIGVEGFFYFQGGVLFYFEGGWTFFPVMF